MPIIDAHVHLYPANVDRDPAAWAEAQGERHWAVLCTRKRRNGQPVQTLPTLAQLLAAMDAARVDRAVLLGWYWENPGTCAWQNRFYAECVRAHPDRLAAFATLHPAAGRDATLAELRRAREDGLVGVGELSPHSQRHRIDEPVFQEMLSLAGELRMPVTLHVTDPESRPFTGRIDTPSDDFLRLARGFPGTTFILAHWGGLLPLRDERFRSLGNVFYDTAASPLLYDAGVWSRAIPVLGEDRVLFGSDFPLNLYPTLDELPGLVRLVGEARKAGVGDAVLGGTAEQLLKGPRDKETKGLRENNE
ncbi:MAG: amidohydrolase family protein [Opitutaceae bacterium]|nr:amidohydrolase family protein [Opitutaceae bacterium]